MVTAPLHRMLTSRSPPRWTRPHGTHRANRGEGIRYDTDSPFPQAQALRARWSAEQAGQRCAARACAISALVALQTFSPCQSSFGPICRWWRSSGRFQPPVESAKGASIARNCQSAVVKKAVRKVAPAATSPSWAGQIVDKPPPSCALIPNDHDLGV